MVSQRGARSVGRWCGLAMLLLAVGGMARAADEQAGDSPRLVRVSAGYTQSVRPGQWFPIRMIIANPGPAADTELVVVAEDAENTPPSFISRSPLHLPARSTLAGEVYAAGETWQRIRIELHEGGRRIAQQMLQESWAPPHDTRILGVSVLSDRSFTCPQPVSSQSSGPRLHFDNSELSAELPSRWAGYEPMEVLILGSLPPEGLTAMQERAILDWVHSGGLLILNPGGGSPHYGPLIESVSPVQMFGARLVESLPPLAQRYGSLDLHGQRLGLTEAILRDGAVQMQMGSLALVASRREGAGTVAFVAFDLTHERIAMLPNLAELYRDLIELRGALPRASGTPLSQEAARTLGETAGAPVLPRWALTACLGANLALVAALLIVFRKRREVAFAVLVLGAPCVALLINAIGAAATGVAGTTLASLQVVRSGGACREAGVNGCYALLSANASQFNIRFPELPSAFPCGLALPSPGPEGHAPVTKSAGGTIEFMDGDLKWLRRFSVQPRTTSMFQFSGVAALPAPIEATATIQSDGIHFEIVNRSDKRFTDGLVAFNRNAVGIADLAPGERTTAVLNSGTAQGMMANLSTAALRSKQGAMHDRLLRALFAARRDGELFDTGAQVFGWMEDEPVAVELPGLAEKPARIAQTLRIVSAGVRAGEGRILLPKGAPAMQLAEPIKPLLLDGAWRPVQGAETFDIAYAVPVEVRDMKAERIVFFLRTARVPMLKTLAAFNVETGQYDPVAGDATPAADERRFSLPAPANCLSPVTGKVLLRLDLRPEQPADLTRKMRAAVIEDLDLEIEGTR